MKMKKVQATFCRSVKFKTSHKFIQSFAFNRSTKGDLNLFQKRDFSTSQSKVACKFSCFFVVNRVFEKGLGHFSSIC